MKWLISSVITIFLLGFAVIPETVMYLCYSMLDPATFTEKILTIGLFWFIGGSLCVLFFWGAVALWFIIIGAIWKF